MNKYSLNRRTALYYLHYLYILELEPPVSWPEDQRWILDKFSESDSEQFNAGPTPVTTLVMSSVDQIQEPLFPFARPKA
jgi:hypothetical protein